MKHSEVKNPEDFCLDHSANAIWILRCAQNDTPVLGVEDLAIIHLFFLRHIFEMARIFAQ